MSRKIFNSRRRTHIPKPGEMPCAAGKDDPIELDQGVGFRQYAVAFSPDGRFLASGGAHGKYGVELWEVATGKKIRNMEDGNDGGWMRALTFSNDGKRIYALLGGKLRLHDVETGELLDAMGGEKDAPNVNAFALSPDSRRLAVHRGKVVVYDLTAEGFSKVLLEIPQKLSGTALIASDLGVHLSFSPDGKRLMASASGDSVIYDSFTGEEQLTLRGGSSRSQFLADSQRVISTDGDRRVKVWDASTNHESTKTSIDHLPFQLSKDGGRLIVLLPPEGMEDPKLDRIKQAGRLGVVDTATGKLISTMLEHEPSMVDGAAFSADGKWAASGARDGTFRVWDPQTGKVKQTVETPRVEHYAIGFGPKGDTIISRTEKIRGLAIWEIATGEEIFSPRMAIDEVVWAMSPDGHRLASGDSSAAVRIWDTTTGKELRKWQAHEGQQFSAFSGHDNECMQYSADGKHLVTGGNDGVVKIWNPETGKLERSLLGHARGITGVRYSPDQRRLISNSFDGTLRIWDPATGKELLLLTDPLFNGVYLWWVALSPDGRKLIAAPGNKRGIITWEAATPKQVASWRHDEEADAALWAAEQPKLEARMAERDAKRAKK